MVGVGGTSPGADTRLADLEEVRADLCMLVSRLAPESAIPFAQEAQRMFSAIELAKTAELKRSGAGDRKIRNTASAGGTRSTKEANRASKRASAANENPDLINDVANGELGTEQLDAIASASDKTDGDAARDETLVEKIKQAPVDDADKITSRWLEDRDDEHSTETAHERQRRKRKVRTGVDPETGMAWLHATGDRASIREMAKAMRNHSKGLHRNDGGRNLPKHKHPRTRDQRDYDALHQLIVGNNESDAKKGPTGGVRSTIHLSVTVDDLSAEEIKAACIGGAGYLPQSVLSRYGCGATIALTLFSKKGELLWHGRHLRRVTNSQLEALIARDGGCVVCGADPEFCEAHHLTPWNAPARGKTNVEEMALVCTDHHHWIHEENLTLYWQLGPPDPDTGHATRIWRTRPATFDETPPPRTTGSSQPASRTPKHHAPAPQPAPNPKPKGSARATDEPERPPDRPHQPRGQRTLSPPPPRKRRWIDETRRRN